MHRVPLAAALSGQCLQRTLASESLTGGIRAQVTLTDEDGQTLSQIMGVATEVLLHEAVESYLGHHQTAHRLAALRQARGIWS